MQPKQNQKTFHADSFSKSCHVAARVVRGVWWRACGRVARALNERAQQGLLLLTAVWHAPCRVR